MKERGLSLSKLARMADMPNSTLIKIEGGLASPRVETIERLAEQLEVEPYELLKPAAMPIAGRRRTQRGSAATGVIVRTAASLMLLLALPGMTKVAAPIIHRSSPRNSPGRAR